MLFQLLYILAFWGAIYGVIALAWGKPGLVALVIGCCLYIRWYLRKQIEMDKQK